MIQTLGRLVVLENNIAISGFVSQKTVALLVYLVAHPGIHQRDILAEMFWSDTTGKQALKNLRTVLSNLQKKVGAYLDVTRQTLEVINRDQIQLDIHQFDTMLDAIDRGRKQPYSPRKQMNDIARAINLYHGEFLLAIKTDNAPELDTWITLERERLRGRVVKALFQITETALNNGYYEQGVSYGRRLLTLEPWWEDAVQMMMRLHVYDGNRSAALQQYQAFEKQLWDDLEVEPEEDTQKLFKLIKTGRLQAVEHVRPNNLIPLSRTYVENQDFVARMLDVLDLPETRVMTLLGTGGIGKSSLAHYVAHNRLEDYQDGVYFVALASLTTPNFVPQAILNALGIPQRDSTRSARDVLLEHLRERHLLLILDNFEHILSAADLVADIVAHAPFVQLIVTSREQLHIQHEYVYPLVGLPLNTERNEIPAALRLFELTAKQQNVDFSLDDHFEAVERICQLVDGMPLGIVIAAGWLNTLSAEDVAERISESLDFLTIHRRDLPERHRGITALLDSSWGTLIEAEQHALMMLSAFPGDFDVDAALQVADADVVLLRVLVSKSLLQVDAERRYSLHELLRRYAHSKSVNADLLETARRAHHDYYHRWITELDQRRQALHFQFAEIDREYHNLWSFDWLPLDEQRAFILHLSLILPDYWIARGDFMREGIALIEEGLNSDSIDPQLRIHAMIMLGKLRFHVGLINENTLTGIREAYDRSKALNHPLLTGLALNELECLLAGVGKFEEARTHLYEMIDLYESLPDPVKDNAHFKQVISRAYTNLGVTSLQVGDFDIAEEYALKGIEINISENDDVGLEVGYNTLGIIHLEQGELTKAQDYFTRALETAKGIQHTRHITIFSGNLAEVLHKQGQIDKAYAMYCDTLRAAYRIGNRKTMLNVLEQLVDLMIERGQAENAGILYGNSLQLRDTITIAIQPREMPSHEARREKLDAHLSATQLAQLIEEGREISLDDITNYAESMEKLSE